MFWTRRGDKRLLDENRRLKSENEALRERVALLEDNRRVKQWDNLLGYDGRPQPDNLGRPDDGEN